MKYGLIGNCKTAALVSEEGSIDWCCFPKFDSPSLFAKILDDNAGFFGISMPVNGKTTQKYLEKTTILQTTYDDGVNSFAVLDFMPRFREGEKYNKPIEIYRILKPLRGKPSLKIQFKPKLNYHQGKSVLKIEGDKISVSNGLEQVFLYSSLDLQNILDEQDCVLDKDHFLLLSYHEKFAVPTLCDAYQMYEKTKSYWEAWSQKCRLPNLYTDAVLRSALTLKLLTYDETGAVVAAPTTSLPETIGETRNWDYRFCWLRDASMMLESLKSLGHFEEAKGFISFLLKIFESKQTKIQIMYTIDGGTELEEKILSHLSGYKKSAPVRIGNKAVHMRQNDIFGEILNALYLYYFHYQFESMSEEVWSLVKFLVNAIVRDWKTRDAGIWEFRKYKKHFTHSKILSWAALDRGSKIAQKLGKLDWFQIWNPIAEEVKKDVFKKGWSKEMRAFTQFYGSNALDASILQSLRYGFFDPKDKKWIDTVHACEKHLMNNGFTFRYTNVDDFGKPRSAFLVASFWMVKALYSIGELDKAHRYMQNILSHANHLGLFSEDIDPVTGELLGNFPQAYSHMAVINVATLMARNHHQ